MPEHETQMPALPGWGAPFPEEKPRVDAPPEAGGDGMPTAASVAAASYTGDDVAYDFRHEDRRRLDGKRIRAYLIDEALLGIVAFGVIEFLINQGVTVAMILMCIAFKLSYYFVGETVFGRTIGKKLMGLVVVRTNGRGAPPSKVAARTIFRLIEDPVIAIFSMAFTGKRRMRIGDIAGGTIVRLNDRPFVRAPESPLLVVYPILWFAGALGGAAVIPEDTLFGSARNDHPYMARIDKICEKRYRMETALQRASQRDILTIHVFMKQEQRKIEKLPPPPPEVEKDVAEVIRVHRDLNREMDRTIRDMRNAPGDPTPAYEAHAATLVTMAENAQLRFVDLGLPNCAA